MDQVMLRIARDHDWAPVVGGYMVHSPRLFIQDPELAKAVLVKDFSVFHDRMSPSLFHNFVAAGSKADNVMVHQDFLILKKWFTQFVKIMATFFSDWPVAWFAQTLFVNTSSIESSLLLVLPEFSKVAQKHFSYIHPAGTLTCSGTRRTVEEP